MEEALGLMNNFEKFLVRVLIEARGPERHGHETQEREFHKAVTRQEKDRKAFEKSGGPKSEPWAEHPSPEKDEEFHQKIINKGKEAAERRASRLQTQFKLKRKAKKLRGVEFIKHVDKRSKRSIAKGGKDETEFAQDHLNRPY